MITVHRTLALSACLIGGACVAGGPESFRGSQELISLQDVQLQGQLVKVGLCFEISEPDQEHRIKTGFVLRATSGDNKWVLWEAPDVYTHDRGDRPLPVRSGAFFLEPDGRKGVVVVAKSSSESETVVNTAVQVVAVSGEFSASGQLVKLTDSVPMSRTTISTKQHPQLKTMPKSVEITKSQQEYIIRVGDDDTGTVLLKWDAATRKFKDANASESEE